MLGTKSREIRSVVECSMREAGSVTAGVELVKETFLEQSREFIGNEGFDLAHFNIGDLAAETIVYESTGKAIGHSDLRDLISQENPRKIMESGSINTNAFANITASLLTPYSIDAFNLSMKGADELVTLEPNSGASPRIPGIELPYIDEDQEVQEGEPYPVVKTTGKYTDVEKLKKRGYITQITAETLMLKETVRNLIDTVKKISIVMAGHKRRRILRTILGIVNNYNLNGQTTATFRTALGGAAWNHWINQLASNPLVNYEAIDALNQLFSQMVDPETGEHIELVHQNLIVSPAKKVKADFITGALKLNIGDTTAVGAIQTEVSNHESITGVTPWTHADVPDLLGNSDDFIYGDTKSAVKYFEGWPIRTRERSNDTDADFYRDVLFEHKTSEYGVAQMMQPRYLTKSIG